MTKLAACLMWILLAVAAVAFLNREHEPLLVQAAVTTDGEAQANKLYAPCPLSPKNIPLRQERTA